MIRQFVKKFYSLCKGWISNCYTHFISPYIVCGAKLNYFHQSIQQKDSDFRERNPQFNIVSHRPLLFWSDVRANDDDIRPSRKCDFGRI